MWSEYTANARETVVPPITLTLDESEEIAAISAEVDTYKKEMILKFVKGLEPMENYDAFVETLRSMGADRLTEIYQGALDRYNQR